MQKNNVVHQLTETMWKLRQATIKIADKCERVCTVATLQLARPCLLVMTQTFLLLCRGPRSAYLYTLFISSTSCTRKSQ